MEKERKKESREKREIGKDKTDTFKKNRGRKFNSKVEKGVLVGDMGKQEKVEYFVQKERLEKKKVKWELMEELGLVEKDCYRIALG